MSLWRHRLRRLRRGLGVVLAGLLMLLALGNGIGSQLLPMVEQHPEDVARWLGERAGRPVAFDHLTTQWTRRGPLLRLRNLRLGDPADPLRIGDAEILVAQYAGLLPGRSFTELRVRGLDLVLQRLDDGSWQVRGLPGQRTGGDPLQALERLGELQLTRARLHVHAPAIGLDVRVPRIDVRLRVDGARLRLGAQAWLQGAVEPLAVAADISRRNGDGTVYAGSRRLDLAPLAGALTWAGVSPVAGRGRLQAWATLRGHRVVAVQADAGLLAVSLRGATVNGTPGPVHALGELVLAARWSGSLDDWQVQVPRLRFGDGAQRQNLDGLVLAGGKSYGLRAPRLKVAPLLRVVMLSDALPRPLRRWVAATRPDAVLEDVAVSGRRGGEVQARARIRGFRFGATGTAPGLHGVGGWLQADGQGARLRFDNAAVVSFDWPAGFGVVHEFKLEGEAVLWRDGAGWAVQTPGLHVDGGTLQLQARGGITFQGDNSRPHLDIAADIGDTPISRAHGFWIHHLMPKATVQWLDAALQGGRLRDVHAVVAGDLDDWPFRSEPGLAGAGVFRADARIVDGTVKFQPDWPAAEQLNAGVSFVADGFTVDGQAHLAGVSVSGLKAGIARFGQAELTVDATARADAGKLLDLLRASPLHKEQGEVMDALRASGPARVTYAMRLPLHHQHPVPPTIAGNVALEGVRLQETRWKLDFEQVRGEAKFDQGGFVAESLRVRNEQAPGVLSLRAGPHVQDATHAFEAQLQTRAGIGSLLDKADGLDRLKPYMRGSADWNVVLAVPRVSTQSAPTQLRLRSNLVGTAIDLPAPLRKPAAQALPASVDLQLPFDAGDVEVKLGTVLSLRSRSNQGQTGIRVLLGPGQVAAPPARGFVATGAVDHLDVLDWIGVFGGQREGEGIGLQRIDVAVDALRLLGTDFADAHLVLAPAARGLAVQVQAPTIAGALLIPEQEGATVAGRFERLHWAVATGKAVAEQGAANPFDPTKIPPLVLEVGDLRLGGVGMGAASFRTLPVANGLRLQQFSTSGGKQRLQATGTWLGQAASARSQLTLDVDSDDIGTMLSGFGFAGQVAGGKGKLHVQANWRGGPEAFDPRQMTAQIAVDAHDGRLLGLEPGAGRVLGLLGVTQLRRRLSLDFSDFFAKGFAFDRVQGNAQLSQGTLRTEDLVMKGPAADIHLRGSTDLRLQRFDQTVDVLPKSGGLLTAVGALAGGPVGAAVGAVANAVLDKPMQGLGAKTYRVTGPWSSPKVETLDRKAADADARKRAD